MNTQTLITALIGALGGILPGGLFGSWLAAKQDKRRGDIDHVALVQQWRLEALESIQISRSAEDRASEAKQAAECAARAAESSERRAEAAEAKLMATLAYVRVLWRGVLKGIVPPHPPIPYELADYLSDEDFKTE